MIEGDEVRRPGKIPLWQAGLVGLLCGGISAFTTTRFEELGRHSPGLIFGIGMALLLSRVRPAGVEKWRYRVMLAAFIGLSTTAYQMAVQIANHLYQWLPSEASDRRLLLCGFVAGLFGAAKLTAVVQLTRLRAMNRWQWLVCPLTGAIFGLLLHPCLELPDYQGPPVLFIPWQAAVAVALLGFGPPVVRGVRESVIASKAR